MKTIGLIGGMSWESSLEYYRIINEVVRERLGGLHSAEIIMNSIDFAPLAEMQAQNRWDEAGEMMADAARSLERAGAGCVLIGANTMHKVAEAVEAAVQIPLIHIANATAQRVKAAGIGCVGLLGTRFTMEEPFYASRLVEQYGLDVLIPPAEMREVVHRVIYDELCLGITKEASRDAYREIMADLQAQGAQGIILGCTEIALLVKPEDSPLPMFDTTRIHAEAAVDWALETP